VKIMKPSSELAVAREAISAIANRFPSLRMIEEPEAPNELSIRLPVQPGLNHEVWLAFQNNDELHFSVGHFWLEWFPCSKPSRVSEYIAAVTGFLSGDYRILEHYLGKRCIRAELQAPTSRGWQTIGTWRTFLGLLPMRGSLCEITNAQPTVPRGYSSKPRWLDEFSR
jgi:hypothetical protein